MAELSTKPYLIRAIHEWCTDAGYRPYIAVAVDQHTIVPREFVQDGAIVLNLSSQATNHLRISNEMIEFEARFGGAARAVSIPIGNVSAIYAQETGQGMAFEVPRAQDSIADDGSEAPDAAGGSSASTDEALRPEAPGRAQAAAPKLAAVPASKAPARPKRRRPAKVVSSESAASESKTSESRTSESGTSESGTSESGTSESPGSAASPGETPTPSDKPVTRPPTGKPRLTRVK